VSRSRNWRAQKGSADLSLAIRVDGISTKFRAVGHRKGDKVYLRHAHTMLQLSRG
jgi:hypothetical protein